MARVGRRLPGRQPAETATGGLTIVRRPERRRLLTGSRGRCAFRLLQSARTYRSEELRTCHRYPTPVRGIRGVVGRSPAANEPVYTETARNYSAWLPRWSTQGFIGHRNDQWYALAPEFCLVGIGQTPDDAHRDLMALIDAYLHSYYTQGRSFEDARRPVGPVATLRILLSLKRRKRLTLSPSLLH